MPQALTDYIKGRQGYDYNEHGRAGNTHTEFVPDEIVDRFCILGTAEEHIAKLKELHGDRGRPSSPATSSTTTRRRPCASTARSIIPAIREHVTAKV